MTKIEQHHVDAASKVIGHLLDRKHVVEVLEAAAAATPPVEADITTEMTNAGQLIAVDWISRGCTGSSQLWCMVNYIYKAMRALDPAFKGGQTAAYTGHDRRERGRGFGSGMTQAHFDAFERAERRGKSSAEPAPAIKQYTRVVTDERVTKDRRSYDALKAEEWFAKNKEGRRDWSLGRRSADQ